MGVIHSSPGRPDPHSTRTQVYVHVYVTVEDFNGEQIGLKNDRHIDEEFAEESVEGFEEETSLYNINMGLYNHFS